MISSETPYKLAEIIRDTWPNLYSPPKDFRPPSKSYNESSIFSRDGVEELLSCSDIAFSIK